jgi:hypothetical protein
MGKVLGVFGQVATNKVERGQNAKVSKNEKFVLEVVYYNGGETHS